MVGAAIAGAVAAALGSGAAAAPPPTPAQLAGQRVLFAYAGTNPPAALLRRLRRGEAAGVILFDRNVRSRADLRADVRRIQRAARSSPLRAPALITVDQEGGRVRRLPGGPARSAAAVSGRGSARADGRAAAGALRGAGANVDLAPVADVCRSGSALDRERRCYAHGARAVTSLAGAFGAGLGSRRVGATLKHFPGFGAAGVNTDNAPVRIRVSRTRLRAVHERPFRALRRRAAMVMLSTAIYPALDGRLPAAFSRAVVTGELRRRVGFAGVTVTDALDTPATRRYGNAGRLARRVAKAGGDLVVFAGSYGAGDRAARGLEASLRRGELQPGPARRSAARVLALRRRFR